MRVGELLKALNTVSAFLVGKDGLFHFSSGRVMAKTSFGSVDCSLPEGVLIPCAVGVERKLEKVLKTFSSDTEVTLKFLEKQIGLKVGKSKYRFSIIDETEHPYECSQQTDLGKFDSEQLGITLSSVSNAVSETENVILNGVCLELERDKLSIQGTDGKQMAISSLSLEGNLSKHRLLIPEKGVRGILCYLKSAEVCKGKVVNIAYDQKFLELRSNDSVCTVRLANAQGYPPLLTLVSGVGGSNTFSASPSDLMAALKRLSIMLGVEKKGDLTQLVIIESEGAALRLSSNYGENYEEEIAITGEVAKVILNRDFLMKSLQPFLVCERVDFKVSSTLVSISSEEKQLIRLLATCLVGKGKG